MFWIFLALALYLAGVGAARAILDIIDDRWNIFEDDTWFTMLSIVWPVSALPVGAYCWVIIKFANREDS